MKEQFVPYELAFKIKELGFDEECLGFYTELQNLVIKENVKQQDCVSEKCIAPLWQQAFDWFRRKYDLISWVYKTNIDTYYFSILRKDRYLHGLTVNCVTYEEARLECLKKLIELVKTKKDSV